VHWSAYELEQTSILGSALSRYKCTHVS